MNNQFAALLASTFVFLMFTSVEATAQVASSLEQLQILVEAGDEVTVTRFDGTMAKGEIEQVLASSLRISQDRKPLELPQAELLEIRKKDSIRNGTRMGAIVGGAVGLGLGTLGALLFCDKMSCAPGAVATVAVMGGISAGVGAVIGGTLDSVFNRNPVVFRAPRALPSTRLHIAPLLSGNRTGFRLSLSF